MLGQCIIFFPSAREGDNGTLVLELRRNWEPQAWYLKDKWDEKRLISELRSRGREVCVQLVHGKRKKPAWDVVHARNRDMDDEVVQEKSECILECFQCRYASYR